MIRTHLLLTVLLTLVLASGLLASDRVSISVNKTAVITSPLNDENRSMVKFDLGETLQGRNVEYAAVEIQFEIPDDKADHYTAFIFPLKKDFSTSATWSDNFTREGVDYYPEHGLSITVSERHGYKVRVLLYKLVDLWANGTIENHGFIIVCPNKGLDKARIKNTTDAVSKLTLYHEKAN